MLLKLRLIRLTDIFVIILYIITVGPITWRPLPFIINTILGLKKISVIKTYNMTFFGKIEYFFTNETTPLLNYYINISTKVKSKIPKKYLWDWELRDISRVTYL